MTALVSFCKTTGICLKGYEKNRLCLVEAALLIRICKELQNLIANKYKDYFFLINVSKWEQNMILETNFFKEIIHDILATEEYTIKGIALYVDTPEEVIQELLAGRNQNPSAFLLQKLIKLHETVRKELYSNIFKKIFNDLKTTCLL